MVTVLMMSAKITTLGLLTIKVSLCGGLIGGGFFQQTYELRRERIQKILCGAWKASEGKTLA